MTYQMRFGALCLGTMLVTGCATTHNIGNEFDSGAINKIKTGVSTKSDVLSLMGQPFRKNTSPDGISIWSYLLTTSTSTRTAKNYIPLVGGLYGGKYERESKDLTISFNKSNVVEQCMYKTFSSNKETNQEGVVAAASLGAGGETISMKCEDVK